MGDVGWGSQRSEVAKLNGVHRGYQGTRRASKPGCTGVERANRGSNSAKVKGNEKPPSGKRRSGTRGESQFNSLATTPMAGFPCGPRLNKWKSHVMRQYGNGFVDSTRRIGWVEEMQHGRRTRVRGGWQERAKSLVKTRPQGYETRRNNASTG